MDKSNDVIKINLTAELFVKLLLLGIQWVYVTFGVVRFLLVILILLFSLLSISCVIIVFVVILFVLFFLIWLDIEFFEEVLVDEPGPYFWRLWLVI